VAEENVQVGAGGKTKWYGQVFVLNMVPIRFIDVSVIAFKYPLTHSFTHSLDRHFVYCMDRLTGDGSLHPTELTITGHVPSSIGGEPDVGFQLTDPGMSRATAWTFPFRPVVWSVTRAGFDSQAKCFCAGTDSCRRRTNKYWHCLICVSGRCP